MFYQNFIRLCAERNVRPNTVTRELGLSTATATNWKDGSIPRDMTLRRIADYFGVTVDYLLGKEPPKKEKPATEGDTLVLSEIEKKIILSYRAQPNMHESICRLLGIVYGSP